MREDDRKEGIQKFVTYMFLILSCLFMFIPVYWIIVAATVPQEVLLTATSPRLIPGTQFMENFQALQDREVVDYLGSVWNSVIIATIYTLLALVFCSMGGFAFAKYDFKYKEIIFFSILGTLIIPLEVLAIPLFLMMSQLNLTNTFSAVILPFAAYPIGIFLMRQSMQSIPDSILESARMDGATEFQLYYRIALPTMKSSLAALTIILFLFQWDLFLYPLVVLNEGKFTMPVAINQLVGADVIYYDQLMVAAAIAILPMFILFLSLQKYFIQGILSGAVKGD